MNQDQFKEFHELMTFLQGKEMHNHPADVISKLFMLHNLVFPHEYSKSCSGCRARVYNRCKNYWNENRENVYRDWETDRKSVV